MRQIQLSCFLIFYYISVLQTVNILIFFARDICQQMLRRKINCFLLGTERPLCVFLPTCYLCFRNVDWGLSASMTFAMQLFTNFKWIWKLIKYHKVNKCHTWKKIVDKKDTFDIIVVMYRFYITPAFEVVSGYTF